MRGCGLERRGCGQHGRALRRDRDRRRASPVTSGAHEVSAVSAAEPRPDRAAVPEEPGVTAYPEQ